jgi:hypothetical protein
MEEMKKNRGKHEKNKRLSKMSPFLMFQNTSFMTLLYAQVRVHL